MLKYGQNGEKQKLSKDCQARWQKIGLMETPGEKGKRKKTQIFVEPDIRRLAFDQKTYIQQTFLQN